MNIEDIKIGETYSLGRDAVVALAKYGSKVWCKVPWDECLTYDAMRLRPIPPTEVERKVVVTTLSGAFVTFRPEDIVEPDTIHGHLIKWSDGTVTYEAVKS